MNTNIKYLVDNSINIWNKDAYNYYLKHYHVFSEEPITFDSFIDIISDKSFKVDNFKTEKYNIGDLGKIYGYFWRNFNGVDQIAQLIDELEPMLHQIMTGNSWIRPIKTKEELKKWCMDNQPYYKKHIPEVVKYFCNKYKIK